MTISPHYFVFYKGGLEVLGYDWATQPVQLRLQAVRIGVQATWWMGLAIGAVVLLANSYPRRWPSLPMCQLLRLLPAVLAVALALAAALGAIGYLRPPGWVAQYPPVTVGDVRRFAAVWMIHAGGYLGGLLGAAWAVGFVLRRRRRQHARGSDVRAPQEGS